MRIQDGVAEHISLADDAKHAYDKLFVGRLIEQLGAVPGRNLVRLRIPPCIHDLELGETKLSGAMNHLSSGAGGGVENDHRNAGFGIFASQPWPPARAAPAW